MRIRFPSATELASPEEDGDGRVEIVKKLPLATQIGVSRIGARTFSPYYFQNIKEFRRKKLSLVISH